MILTTMMLPPLCGVLAHRREPAAGPRRRSRAHGPKAGNVAGLVGGSFVALTLVFAAPSPPAVAAAPASTEESAETKRRLADLERRLEELTQQLAAARASGAGVSAERLAELERRLDVLAEEIERLRSGLAVAEPAPAPARGLGPAAAKVYARDRGVSVGGYGEVLYQNFDARADDGSPAEEPDTLDLVRAVLYFGYKFDGGIVFNSEIEYEHATTGEGDEEKGEVSVEFAYLDFPLGSKWGLRAGQLLVPVGLVNELHEPPIFLGARRPDVERVIIPSTWREVGAGLYGETGPLVWRAYLQAGLDASGFSADEGIREGRQGGSSSRAEDLALTARLDWTPSPGLLVGGSFFSGDAGQGLDDPSGRTLSVRTRLFDLHADWKGRGWQARALVARGRVSDVARLDAALGLGGAESIGERSRGWYAELGYDLRRDRSEGGASLIPYVRYERYDTQEDVPEGFERDPALDVRVGTIGVAYKPIPNIVVKADYQDYENRAGTGIDRFNLAMGYLF